MTKSGLGSYVDVFFQFQLSHMICRGSCKYATDMTSKSLHTVNTAN